MTSLALLADTHALNSLLRDLAVVLCVAAVTTVVFQRLRQPVVLGYLLAGIILGPHTPGATIQDLGVVHDLSEIGMVLVLFSIGLEFSFGRLVELGPRPAFVGALQVGGMLWLGFLAGRWLGLDARASLFVGGIVSISSTVLIQRVFLERNVEKHIQETVLGVLVYEDLVGILLVAGLTTLAAGEGLDLGAIGVTGGRLLFFLAAVIVVGLLIVPRAVRFVIRLRRNETTIIASLGLCFAFALLAQGAGYSTALGAFLAGSLASESGHGHEIAKRTQPVVDVFAAIFFVSIGMLIDPALLVAHWPAIVLLTVVTIVGKIVGTALGLFLVGEDRRTALRSGISMAQIGEFAFLIAGLGVATKAVPEWLVAVAVGVSTITAFVTPYFIGRSDMLAGRIDRALPQRLQTFASLYTSWIADIRAHGSRDTRSRAVRRGVRIVVLDTVVLVLLVIAGALLAERVAQYLESSTHVGSRLAFAIVVAAVAALCVPLILGLVGGSRVLSRILSEMAMPAVSAGRADPARAPRAALVAALQLSILTCAGLVIVAATSPFLPRYLTPIVLLAAIVPAAWIVWRAATNLEGHVRAGAEVIAEALARRSAQGADERVSADLHAPARDGATSSEGTALSNGTALSGGTALSDGTPGAEPMELVQGLLPGLGEITMVGVRASSAGSGRTLAELDVRSLTGANVVVLQRGRERFVMPSGSERLAPGDVLALSGSTEAVEQAVRLIRGEAAIDADAPEPRITNG